MPHVRRTLLALACALASALSVAPARAALPDQAGAPSMENLEHVYNYDVPGAPVTEKASDIEFYTANVPLRDYTTGELILDPGGNPIPADRDFAVVGSELRGAYIFDITDPESPQFVRRITCSQIQNDVQIKRFGSRWVLALAMDDLGSVCATPRIGSGSGGISLFDITDPYLATPIVGYRSIGGAHNFTFHPTQPYGWISTGDLPGRINHLPIIDLTNLFATPASITMVANLQTVGGPHDVSFSADGTRAYVANENNARIYNSTNPAAPVLIGTTVGPATYVHGLDPTPDGKHMVLTDESLALGGFFASGSGVCPGGGLTFYDIEGMNESAPIPVGYFTANVVGNSPDHRACTAHVGRITPNSQLMVLGWYIGGVRVVDISDPSMPREIGHAVMPGTEVWSAKIYKGPYVYTSDEGRGFDVYRWTGSQPFGN